MRNNPVPNSSRKGLLWGAMLVLALLAIAVGAACSFLWVPPPSQAGERTPTTTATSLSDAVPGLTISPEEGAPGTRIVAVGRGWRPGDTVVIRLEDPATGQKSALEQASALVSDRGDFAARFTYPNNPPWTALPRVLVTATDSTTHQRVSVLFRVTVPVTSTVPPPTWTATEIPTAVPTSTQPARKSPTPYPTPRPATATLTRPPVIIILPTATPVPSTATPLPAITDWRGEYYANMTLASQPALVRNDAAIDFNWGLGSPAPGLPVDDFSVRWTRGQAFDSATYRFYLTADDGARLWVDGRLLIDEWRDGSARQSVADYALARGTHSLRVEYYEHTGGALAQLRWERLTPVPITDWLGEYWPNPSLAGSPTLVRNDPAIDFYWGLAAPAPGLPVDNFSVRWTRQVTFAPGLYRLSAQADDGIRVYVDGWLAIDEWRDSNGAATYAIDLSLSGTRSLKVEYYDRTGQALVRFWWTLIVPPPVTPVSTVTATATPSATASPTRTPTATASRTPTPTRTGTRTPTATATTYLTATPTSSPTLTAAPTETPTATASRTSSPSPTASPTGMPTETPTETPTPTPTSSPSPTASPTETPTETPTATPSLTPTSLPSPAASPTETATETPTATPWPTSTLSPSPTASPTETATETPTPEVTWTSTPGTLATATPTGTVISVETGTAATSTPTASRTSAPARLSPVRINELFTLPQPAASRGTRTPTPQGQWIELYNASGKPVDVGGWKLVTGKVDERGYQIPTRTVLRGGAYLVLQQRQTRLVLDAAGGELRLLDRNGKVVDSVRYPALRPEASYSRGPDDTWHSDWPPSPGGSNLPQPTPTATASPAQTLTPASEGTSPITPTPTAA
jgi:hypothetical protein